MATASNSFDSRLFEKKLRSLKDSQDSIQNLSTWCLGNRQHHKRIVDTWFSVLRKAKPENTLPLFYLANDVIQYSKRKNNSTDFVNGWAPALLKAIPLVRKQEKVKRHILRILKIWDERSVYDENLIADLSNLLNSDNQKNGVDATDSVTEFQPDMLVSKIRTVKDLEDETDSNLRLIKDASMTIEEVEEVGRQLKDRHQGEDVTNRLEETERHMESYVMALEKEIASRTDLIDMLEKSQLFYEMQKGEAKVVVTAYRNFAGRVKHLLQKLDSLIPTLPDASPVPSPDVNAPSPPPESDLELPEVEQNSRNFMPGDTEQKNRIKNFFKNMSESAQAPVKAVKTGSSLDTRLLSFMNSAEDNEAHPIEVIGNNSKAFSISDLIKKVTSTGDSSVASAQQVQEGLTSQAPPSNDINKRNTISPSPVPAPFNASTFAVPPPPFGTPLVPPPPLPSVLTRNKDEATKNVKEPSSGEKMVTSPPPPPPPPLRSVPPVTSAQANYSWNTKLPPKFPTWSDDVPLNGGTDFDTPESPPMFEKTAFTNPLEYDDTTTNISSKDVDYRPVNRAISSVQHGSSKDVDHRNLISLTDSPCNSPAVMVSVGDCDYRVQDRDYRQMNKSNLNQDLPQDNVESVDMEMSDDEDHAHIAVGQPPIAPQTQSRPPPILASLFQPPPAPPPPPAAPPSERNDVGPQSKVGSTMPQLWQNQTLAPPPSLPTIFMTEQGNTSQVHPKPQESERGSVNIAFIDFGPNEDNSGEFPPDDSEDSDSFTGDSFGNRISHSMDNFNDSLIPFGDFGDHIDSFATDEYKNGSLSCDPTSNGGQFGSNFSRPPQTFQGGRNQGRSWDRSRGWDRGRGNARSRGRGQISTLGVGQGRGRGGTWSERPPLFPGSPSSQRGMPFRPNFRAQRQFPYARH